MFQCSLLYPDEPWWADEENYNTYIALLLIKAYRKIEEHHASAEAYRQAMDIVGHMRDENMSRRQRMHIYYLIARANDVIGYSSQGIDWIDRTLPLAIELDSDYDRGELLFYRASMNRSALFLARAAEDARDCLAVIDEHDDDLSATDSTTARIQLRPQLATYEFFIADFEAAKAHIAEARKLIAQTPDMSLPAAATAWVQANLHILNRQPERALRPSLEICDIYARKGNAASYERAEILAAQAALAFAQSLPTGTDRDSAIERALPHIKNAERLAQTLNDQPGQALCMLLEAHYARLANHNSGRRRLIGDVIQFADDIKDVAVLAQAHIMLGDEFAASGESEWANECYRATLEMLEGTEIPTLGIPARRALGEGGEFNP